MRRSAISQCTTLGLIRSLPLGRSGVRGDAGRLGGGGAVSEERDGLSGGLKDCRRGVKWREDEEGGLSVGEKITPGRRAGGVWREEVVGGGVLKFTRSSRQASKMLTVLSRVSFHRASPQRPFIAALMSRAAAAVPPTDIELFERQHAATHVATREPARLFQFPCSPYNSPPETSH